MSWYETVQVGDKSCNYIQNVLSGMEWKNQFSCFCICHLCPNFRVLNFFDMQWEEAAERLDLHECMEWFSVFLGGVEKLWLSRKLIKPRSFHILLSYLSLSPSECFRKEEESFRLGKMSSGKCFPIRCNIDINRAPHQRETEKLLAHQPQCHVTYQIWAFSIWPDSSFSVEIFITCDLLQKSLSDLALSLTLFWYPENCVTVALFAIGNWLEKRLLGVKSKGKEHDRCDKMKIIEKGLQICFDWEWESVKQHRYMIQSVEIKACIRFRQNWIFRADNDRGSVHKMSSVISVI